MLGLAVPACEPADRGRAGGAFVDALAADSSEAFAARIGDEIGYAVEARFADDGRYVVVLDRFEPHLRLFSADGRLLWSGARNGGGPMELSDAQVLGTRGKEVIAVQRGGRLSRWVIDHDSLRFLAAVPLPPTLAPMGLVPGCRSQWLLYARNDRQFVVVEGQPVAPTIEYLHTLNIQGDSAVIEPFWSDARDIGAVFGYGHSAALLSRSEDRLALWHRSNGWAAGRIMELTCEGSIVRDVPEISLVTGDSIDVLVPRTKPLEWTSGVASTPQGTLLAIHRHAKTGQAEVPRWRTELFGVFPGSVKSTLLPGQWKVMDYHGGSILLTTDEPVPHFIRLPADIVMARIQGDGGS